jgi:hypothetical protein
MIADAVPDDDESSERRTRAGCRRCPLWLALKTLSASLLGALLPLYRRAIVQRHGVIGFAGYGLAWHRWQLSPCGSIRTVCPHRSVVAQCDEIVDGSRKLNDMPHGVSCMDGDFATLSGIIVPIDANDTHGQDKAPHQ